MDLSGLVTGFGVALTPTNLLFVLVGVVIGMVIGVLPGLGSAATLALLLPLTYTLEPSTAIIMMAGIYYGSMYGGTITSVLLNLPGEAASVVTTFDGYQMAKQGRAGPALGIAAMGSFVGGTVAILGLVFLAPVLASAAVRFAPPEYAALTILGLLLVSYLGTKSLAKSLVAASLGLLLATVGQDPVIGRPRFTFGVPDLFGGLEFVAIAMGLFGIGEILYNMVNQRRSGDAPVAVARVRNIFPSRSDLRQSRGAITRGSLLGFVIGILPGGGGVVSSLVSYAVEKRRAKQPGRFGKGAIEGVAGPETANNASSTSSFIPLLTLGIPSNVALALVYGALVLQGITPGPGLINDHPDVFWGVVASMFIGNVILLALNMPLVGIFVRLLSIRATILAPLTVLVTMVGVYSVNNSVFDMWVALAFGLLGYLMKMTGFEPGPLVLAFVLGGLLEISFRQSLLMSNGSPTIFFTRPISAGLLLAGVALLVVSSRQHRAPQEVLTDDEVGAPSSGPRGQGAPDHKD